MNLAKMRLSSVHLLLIESRDHFRTIKFLQRCWNWLFGDDWQKVRHPHRLSQRLSCQDEEVSFGSAFEAGLRDGVVYGFCSNQ